MSTSTNETPVQVEDLSAAAIGVTPIDFDWSEGYGERWESVPPDTDSLTLEQCHDLLTEQGHALPYPNPWDMGHTYLVDALADDEEEFNDLKNLSLDALRSLLIEAIDDENVDGLDTWREAVRDLFDNDPDRLLPMMNYYYPLPNYDGDAGADQLLLDRSNVTCILVQVGDETVLALAGGGMDLSWDICYSYMLLGYLPPLHYCDLPRFAGLQPTPRNRAILDGCLRSARLAASHAEALERSLSAYKTELSSPTPA